MAAEALLQIRNLSLKLGDRLALDRVSLTVGAGEIVGLLGRNGAGKTTLMKAVMGLLSPDAGELRLQSEIQWVAEETSLPRREKENRSGGELRQLEISRAMSSRPGLLLLDEPFRGVDPIQQDSLKQLMLEFARQGTGVFFSDHNALESLRICDRAYILHEGRILAHGTPGDLSKG